MGKRAVALILDTEWVLQQREVEILENEGSGKKNGKRWGGGAKHRHACILSICCRSFIRFVWAIFSPSAAATHERGFLPYSLMAASDATSTLISASSINHGNTAPPKIQHHAWRSPFYKEEICQMGFISRKTGISAETNVNINNKFNFNPYYTKWNNLKYLLFFSFIEVSLNM